jgi:hypothetical protein
MNTQVGHVTLFGFDVKYYLPINPELPIEDANQKIDKIRHFKFNNPITLDISLEPNQVDPKTQDYLADNKEYNIQDYGLSVDHLMGIVLQRLSARVRDYLQYQQDSNLTSSETVKKMSLDWVQLYNKYMSNITESGKQLIPAYLYESLESSQTLQEEINQPMIFPSSLESPLKGYVLLSDYDVIIMAQKLAEVNLQLLKSLADSHSENNL